MENRETNKYQVKTKKLSDSRLEITASVPASDFDATRSDALKRIGADVELPGFRKGHVPEKVLATKIGEAAILEEMAEIAIGRAYAEIVIGEKIDALGRPEVKITKIAPGNDLEFTLTTAVFPEIRLPDYKKLAAKEAKKKEEITVSDEEIDKTIDEIRRMRKQSDGGQANADDKPQSETKREPLTDDEAKTFGDFASAEDLRNKLRENMKQQKEREAKDKRRVAIMEAIVSDTKIELPGIIVDQELRRMEDEFAHEIERVGMTFDAYIKATGKTREDMVKEWRPDAEKRAKVQLIVSKIAEAEDIKPDEKLLETETAAWRDRYPGASEERIKDYLVMLFTNEKVFEFLESEGGK